MFDVNDILLDPLKFDRKEIELKGIYVNGREHRAIYSTKEDIKEMHGIWLVQEAGAAGGEKAAKELNGKYVRVVGTFHNASKRGTGHFRGWPAELRNIKIFESENANNT